MSDGPDEHGGWGAPCEANPMMMIGIRTLLSRRATCKVPAYCFGAWGVHRSVTVNNQVCDPRSWAVSHIPTGLSIGLALELSFWTAVRIARALEDTCLFLDDELSAEDGSFIFEASIAAGLHDHYVWPLSSAGYP